MSRIGNKPIDLPKGVQVTIGQASISAKGPKGQLEVSQHPLVDVAEDSGKLICKRKNDSKRARSAHGLIRALCQNMITGVSVGFERKLEINGVGYRAEVKGKNMVLQLGYSHPIDYPLPEGIAAKVQANTIVLSGINRETLGAAAAKIRGFRPPEPYKGKGVKYAEEIIVKKVGKAAG